MRGAAASLIRREGGKYERKSRSARWGISLVEATGVPQVLFRERR